VLKKLDLSRNEIKILPEELNTMTQLEVLALGDNRLTTIDGKVSNLNKLKRLDIRSNKIPIEQFHRLQTQLSGTKILYDYKKSG